MLFPIFFILMLAAQKSLFGPMNEDYLNFTEEDGILEYTTAILYFLSFIFTIIIVLNFIKMKNKIFASLCILLSGVFLIAGFEEISWGQRFFHMEATGFFSDNIQNETNFHNLLSAQPYISKIFFLIGFYGAFSWIFLSISKKLKLKSLKKIFIPQRFLIFYFLPAVLSYGWGVIRYLSIPPEVFSYFITCCNVTLTNNLLDMRHSDFEVVELLLSAGIFLVIISKFLEGKTIEKSENSYS